jgi:hypothetical protein
MDSNENLNNKKNDELGTGLSILSFCMPIVGLTIYFWNKSEKPKTAKKACHLALWSMLVSFILELLSYLVNAM